MFLRGSHPDVRRRVVYWAAYRLSLQPSRRLEQQLKLASEYSGGPEVTHTASWDDPPLTGSASTVAQAWRPRSRRVSAGKCTSNCTLDLTPH